MASSFARSSRAVVVGALGSVLGFACTSPADDVARSAGAVGAVGDGPFAIAVENGETQPIHAFADAVRETVYVEAPFDSDRDGQNDRIALDILRPRVTDGSRVSVVMEASPYYRAPAVAPTGLLLPSPPPVPLGQRRWYSEYFVPRGYAVVEVEMQGTGRSTGCPTTGGKEDTASIVAAIDWLNGRARGFREDGSEIAATWSTGNVGMIGVSYNGTLPIAVASQGTPGLKTIVPIAAISGWYDYARDHGIGYQGFDERYPEYLAKFVASRTAREKCADAIKKLGDDAGDDTYDFTPFWQERNYRKNLDRIQASVLLVHGLRDWNVKPHQFSRLWYGLEERNIPRKIWIHKEAHTDPVRLRPDVWKTTLHRWMDHWLYGIDSGTMSEPMATIQRPSGDWETHRTWPERGAPATLVPTGTGGLVAAGGRIPEAPSEQTLVDDPSQSEANLIAGPSALRPYRLSWVGAPLARATRVSGTPEIEVAARFDTESSPLSALLVDYGEATVEAPQDLSIHELMATSCTLLDLQQRTGCAAPTKQPAVKVAAQIVTRGSIDVKNRLSEVSSTPLVSGTTYVVRWDLHPVEHVFAKNHRIGVVLSANNRSYIAVDALARGVTIALDRSRLVLPSVTTIE